MILALIALLGQEPADDSPAKALTRFVSGLSGLSGKDPTPLARTIVDSLELPETLNSVLDGVLRAESGWRFLRDLEIEFKYFDEKDGTQGFGVACSYVKDLKSFDLVRGTTVRGMAFAVRAEGNVAFDQETNPRDFLDFRVAFRFFQSSGGVVREGTTDAEKDELFKLEEELVNIKTRDELKKSPAWTRFSSLIQDRLTTQIFFDASIEAGVESDQSFTREQYVIGARVALDIKAWNAKSPEASFNVFDYPCALIRQLTGCDSGFRVRGSTMPTLIIGLDSIHPRDDDPRTLAGDDSDFLRLRVEASFRSPIARFEGATLFFDVNARYYLELGASDVVRAADLDHFSYVSLALASSQGVYVSYAAGRMPLDARDDVIYEAGLKVNF